MSSHNKFIEKYPAFWIPKYGDRVKIIKIIKEKDRQISRINEYYIGDIGTVRQYDSGSELLLIKLDNPDSDNVFAVVLKFELEPIYE
jgi:hypothetical protein